MCVIGCNTKNGGANSIKNHPINNDSTKNQSDSLNIQLTKDDTLDTTFLLFKLGDSEVITNKKIQVLFAKGKIKRDSKKDLSNDYKYNYSLLIDSKYRNAKSGHYEKGNFIENDNYLLAEIKLSFFEDKLYRIELYFERLPIEDFKLYKENKSLFREDIRLISLGLFDLYKKKYSLYNWKQINNDYGDLDYSYTKGNFSVKIVESLLSNSVIYLESVLDSKMNKKKELEMKKKLEKAKGDI